MASVTVTLKREAAILGWTVWINSVTGESPIVTRQDNGAKINWKPGQAKKMEKYLSDAMKPSTPSPDDLNVGVNLTPVLIPLAIKKSLLYAVLYTGAIIVGTKLMWK